MKNKKSSFSIENLLVVIAILMILTATFAPQFARARKDSLNSASHPAQTARAR